MYYIIAKEKKKRINTYEIFRRKTKKLISLHAKRKNSNPPYDDFT
jgi:hypothetical protein